MVPTGKISEEKSDFFGGGDDLKNKQTNTVSFVILFSPSQYFPEYFKQIQLTSIFFFFFLSTQSSMP